MSKQISKSNSTCSSDQEDSELRRGPWTLEEDTLLVHYISRHGEGRWNLLAKRAGLRRSGKSCRLRWLNYLKPDIKRGNFTTQEQLLILELHSKWGNRWSKIAQHLPGRTDNEIKNYWRTRVQKQARHLNVDANSAAFQDVIRLLWIPRLIQKMEGSSSLPNNNNISPQTHQDFASRNPSSSSSSSSLQQLEAAGISNDFMPRLATQETNGSSSANYSATVDVSHMCQQTNLFPPGNLAIDVRTCYDVDTANLAPMSATGDFFAPVADCCVYESDWVNQDMCDSLWINNNAEELWGLNRQF